MKYWIDKDSENENVIVVNNNTIYIGSCDKDVCARVEQQLAGQNNPIEVLGSDDLVTIPLSQVHGIISRSTDKDVDISYKAKKDIEDKTLFFGSLEKKQDFVLCIDQLDANHLLKSESQQSAVGAAISPLISFVLAIASAYLFIDKLRWLAVIVGGLWVLLSLWMLISRAKQPPVITAWTVRGKYFRKAWRGLKTVYAYAFLLLIILAVYVQIPDGYGHKSLYEQI